MDRFAARRPALSRPRPRAVNGKASFATVWHFCDRVHASELAGVVDIAIFNYIIGPCERRDIKGLRSPGAVSHRAVAKSRYQAAITGIPIGFLPIHRFERIGVRRLGFKARREGYGINANKFSMHVELEIIIRNDVTCYDLSIWIDLNDRHVSLALPP